MISAFAISEHAIPGSTVGALSVLGGTGTYTFSIPSGGDPDGKFTIAGANLNTADSLDFETAASHPIVIEADNGQGSTLSRSLIVSVTNVFEQPDLGPLTLPGSASPGSTLAIMGATPGSAISALLLPAGWGLDGIDRQVTIASDAPVGSQSWSLIETLSDSANSPRVNSGSTIVQESQTLAALSLSPASVSEISNQGDIVGALQDTTPGSLLTLTDDATGRFALSNGNILRGTAALDFETATSHQITVRETLATASNSPRDTIVTITVANVFEEPDLTALSLPTIVSQGTAIAITGATAGSTISAALLPQGWVLDGPNRQIQIANDAALDLQNWSLVETLADSANSPRTTNGSSTVSAAAVAFAPESSGYTMFDARDLPDGAVASWTSGDGRTTVSSAAGAERPSKASSSVSFDGTDDVLSDAARGFGAPAASYNLDAVWNTSPYGDSEQFTNTGVTRAPDGSWWVVNHPAGAPSRSDGILVRFSPDFSAVLGRIDLGSVYGAGTVGGPQGLVYDTDDDTLWFTSALQDEVRNISPGGTPNPAKSIAFANPAGLAIDYASNALIILESEGSAANKSAGVMQTVNKSTKAIINSGTLTDLPDWDQMFFDQDSRALFITGGYEYANASAPTYVGIYSLDRSNYLEQIAYIREPTATAVEGVYYEAGTLWLCNDSGFHGGTGSGLNEVLEYDVGSIVGTKVILCFAGRMATATNTRAILQVGEPFGNTGEQGAGLYSASGSNQIRLFVRNKNGFEVSARWAFAGWGADHIHIAVWDMISGTLDLRIDGAAATFVENIGAGNLATMGGPFTHQNRLALGAAYENGGFMRHCDANTYAVGYRVLGAATDDKLAEIEGWLAHEFSLTQLLPSGHPYKSSPPTA